MAPERVRIPVVPVTQARCNWSEAETEVLLHDWAPAHKLRVAGAIDDRLSPLQQVDACAKRRLLPPDWRELAVAVSKHRAAKGSALVRTFEQCKGRVGTLVKAYLKMRRSSGGGAPALPSSLRPSFLPYLRDALEEVPPVEEEEVPPVEEEEAPIVEECSDGPPSTQRELSLEQIYNRDVALEEEEEATVAVGEFVARNPPTVDDTGATVNSRRRRRDDARTEEEEEEEEEEPSLPPRIPKRPRTGAPRSGATSVGASSAPRPCSDPSAAQVASAAVADLMAGGAPPVNGGGSSSYVTAVAEAAAKVANMVTDMWKTTVVKSLEVAGRNHHA